MIFFFFSDLPRGWRFCWKGIDHGDSWAQLWCVHGSLWGFRQQPEAVRLLLDIPISQWWREEKNGVVINQEAFLFRTGRPQTKLCGDGGCIKGKSRKLEIRYFITEKPVCLTVEMKCFKKYFFENSRKRKMRVVEGLARIFSGFFRNYIFSKK